MTKYNTIKITLLCEVCGKEFIKLASRQRNDLKKSNAGRFCSRNCYNKSNSIKTALGKFGKDNPSWKGGCHYSRGYRMIRVDDHPSATKDKSGTPYVREHRLVMEKHIGRYLNDDEVVHHKNEDITDNRIENLVLMTKAEHSKHHYSSKKLCRKS